MQCHSSRQDAVVLRRLRIGHTRLTHSYLLNRQDQPECSHCACALTVAHVLLECNHYTLVRQRYFNVSSLHELFDTVNAQYILRFIRDIGLSLCYIGLAKKVVKKNNPHRLCRLRIKPCPHWKL